MKRSVRIVLALALLTTGTLSASAPANASAPGAKLQHLIVFMQENRAYDGHVGMALAGRNGSRGPTIGTNPDPTRPGATIAAYHKTSLCEVADLDHSWNGSHTEWDHGKMDGFTKANINSADPNGHRTMGYYTKAELPYYDALYRTFATGDRYFSSVLSQTFPNRFYLLAGTSFGHIRNDGLTPPDPMGFTQKTIFEELDAAGITWKIYANQPPLVFALLFAYVRQHAAGHIFGIPHFTVDAALGQLPQVTFIDPVFLGPAMLENDEHPPSNVQVGQKFVHDRLAEVMSSPNWPSSAVFLTYDEHGGFYDHVSPPKAPRPDNIPPMLQAGDTPGAFDRLGFRVPFALISPYAKPGFTSHMVHDHTSILRTIEERFGLAPLTNRDRTANPLWDMFDFGHTWFATPPALPDPPVNLQLKTCHGVNGSP